MLDNCFVEYREQVPDEKLFDLQGYWERRRGQAADIPSILSNRILLLILFRASSVSRFCETQLRAAIKFMINHFPERSIKKSALSIDKWTKLIAGSLVTMVVVSPLHLALIRQHLSCDMPFNNEELPSCLCTAPRLQSLKQMLVELQYV